MGRRLLYEDVKNFIEVESGSGCKMLDTKYDGVYTDIKIQCICGEVFITTYARFKYTNKTRCEKCSHQIAWDYSKVKQFIDVDSNSGCQLVSEEYLTAKHKIDIKCKCGNIFRTPFGEFLYISKRGGYKRQCNDCGLILKSGENSPLWKGGITHKRVQAMRTSMYREWRSAVYERDEYTCQCCGDDRGSNLQAHHKVNFSENKMLRYDVSNGISLCEACHSPSVYGSFHHTYGTKGNTQEQIEHYIEWYREDVNKVVSNRNYKTIGDDYNS